MRWFIIWKLSPHDKRTLLKTVSTIIVVSQFLTFLSARVFPEWKLNPGFGTQKKCFFPLNKSILSVEVTNTKILWTFFRDQILSPLNGAVPWIEMSQRRGSTVLSIWKRKLTVSSCIKYFLRRPFVQLSMHNWRSKLCLPSKTWSLSVQQSFFSFSTSAPRPGPHHSACVVTHRSVAWRHKEHLGDARYTKSIYALLRRSIVWSLLCYCWRVRERCVLCDVSRDLLFTWYMVHQSNVC